MSGRKPINIAALQAAAKPQPDPVQAVVEAAAVPQPSAPQPATPKPTPANNDEPPEAAVPEAAPNASRAARSKGKAKRVARDDDESAGRAGKVAMQAWVDPAMRREFRLYALQHDRTVDSLMLEGLNDLRRKLKIG